MLQVIPMPHHLHVLVWKLTVFIMMIQIVTVNVLKQAVPPEQPLLLQNYMVIYLGRIVAVGHVDVLLIILYFLPMNVYVKILLKKHLHLVVL